MSAPAEFARKPENLARVREPKAWKHQILPSASSSRFAGFGY